MAGSVQFHCSRQHRSRACRLINSALLLQFVMKHAPGARALRFVRRLPLLKGLSDNMLISVAERMGSETFEVRTCVLLPAVLLGVRQSGGLVSFRKGGCSRFLQQQAGQMLVVAGCMTQHSCMHAGRCLHSGTGALP